MGSQEPDMNEQLSLTHSVFNKAEIFNFGVIRSFPFPPLQVVLFLTYLKTSFLIPESVKARLLLSPPHFTCLILKF